MSQPLQEQQAVSITVQRRPFPLKYSCEMCHFASILHLVNKRCQKTYRPALLGKDGELHQVSPSSALSCFHGSEMAAPKMEMKSSPRFLQACSVLFFRVWKRTDPSHPCRTHSEGARMKPLLRGLYFKHRLHSSAFSALISCHCHACLLTHIPRPSKALRGGKQSPPEAISKVSSNQRHCLLSTCNSPSDTVLSTHVHLIFRAFKERYY